MANAGIDTPVGKNLESGMFSDVAQAVETVYREDWGRIVSALIGMLGDFDLAEDCAQEAFAAATAQWRESGVPEVPRAWIIQTARHKGIDALRRRVTRSGRRIDLTAKEFALLELLLRRQGEVLPRSLIASQVWDVNFDSDTNVIDVAVRRLRAKIDDEFTVKLIRTVRGMGYVIELPEGG